MASTGVEVIMAFTPTEANKILNSFFLGTVTMLDYTKLACGMTRIIGIMLYSHVSL